MTTFGVLGALKVVDSEELRLGRTKRRLLLRLLTVPGRPLSPAAISEAVWEIPRRTGAHNLQSHVHQLRSMLGPGRIETVGRSYRLVVSGDELDSCQFERRMQAAARALADAQPVLAAYLLRRALGLWRGPAWAEVADTAWAYPQAARLNQLRLEAEGLLLEARLAAGDGGELFAGPVWPHPAGSINQSSRGQSEGAAGQWRGGRQPVLSAAGRPAGDS